MLVDAIAKRYGARRRRRRRFTRYADALSAWTKAHRDDPNVLAVAAFAIWNAEDALLDGHDALTPKAKEMLADLDDALQLEPTNLGAHHLRIHLLEELRRSREAVPDAEALALVRLSARHVAPAAHGRPHLGAGRRVRAHDRRQPARDRERRRVVRAGRRSRPAIHEELPRSRRRLRALRLDHDRPRRGGARRRQGRGRGLADQTALRLHEDGRVAELAKGATTGYAAFAAAFAAGAARRARDGARRASTARGGGPDRARADGCSTARSRSAATTPPRASSRTRTRTSGRRASSRAIRRTTIRRRSARATVQRCSPRIRPAEAEQVFAAELKRFPNDPHLEWGLAEALRAQGKDDSRCRVPRTRHIGRAAAISPSPRSAEPRRRRHSLAAAFGYAFAGLAAAWRTQRNLRIHAAIAAPWSSPARSLRLSPAGWAVVALAIALVLAAELANTAIEALVDLVSPGEHPLAEARQGRRRRRRAGGRGRCAPRPASWCSCAALGGPVSVRACAIMTPA